MITQRIANKFPSTNKIRSEGGSVGQALIRPIAQILEEEMRDSFLRKESRSLLTHTGDVGTIGLYDIEDQLNTTLNVDKSVTEIPVSSMSGDGENIFQVYTAEDLLYSPATRLIRTLKAEEYSDRIWHNGDVETYAGITFPNQLHIMVGDSTRYFIRTASEYRTSNTEAAIILYGEDIAGNPIKERIVVTDDGSYWTQWVYAALTKVEWEGFDGYMEIHNIGFDGVEKKIPFLPGVTLDLEGPLHFEVNNGKLAFYTKQYLRGEQYRNIGVTDNNVLLCELTLVDLMMSPIDIADAIIDPYDGRLIVMDGINIYSVHLKELEWMLTSKSDRRSSVIVIPTRSVVPLGEADKLITFHLQPDFQVMGVVIKRTTPTGTVTYLQADRTWGGSTYTIPGQPQTNPVQSWQDLRFESTYDELGTWVYECTAIGANERYTSVTNVLVPFLQVESQLAHTLEAVNLGYVWPGKLMVLDSAFAVHEIGLYRDYGLIRYGDNKLMTREVYDSVLVTV